MKKILFISLFLFSVSASAKSLNVFNTKLEINNKCEIKSTSSDGKVKLTKLSLPVSDNCKFIKYDETNLIHIERISNFYMLLVESTSPTNDGCLSTHTAFVIKRNGSITPAKFSKKSLSCHIDREQKLFHHFAYEMKLMK